MSMGEEKRKEKKMVRIQKIVAKMWECLAKEKADRLSLTQVIVAKVREHLAKEKADKLSLAQAIVAKTWEHLANEKANGLSCIWQILAKTTDRKQQLAKAQNKDKQEECTKMKHILSKMKELLALMKEVSPSKRNLKMAPCSRTKDTHQSPYQRQQNPRLPNH